MSFDRKDSQQAWDSGGRIIALIYKWNWGGNDALVMCSSYRSWNMYIVHTCPAVTESLKSMQMAAISAEMVLRASYSSFCFRTRAYLSSLFYLISFQIKMASYSFKSFLCFYVVSCTAMGPTHRWLAHTATWFGHRSAGPGLNDLWADSHWEVLVLLGPLGLQSQLIGNLKRLAQRQYNLIGQVLDARREERDETNDLTALTLQWDMKFYNLKQNSIKWRSGCDLRSIWQELAAALRM